MLIRTAQAYLRQHIRGGLHLDDLEEGGDEAKLRA
jgi:hypothetical protein